MLLEVTSKHQYELLEDTKIKTECGALYQAKDLEFNRTIAVKMVEIHGENKRDREADFEKAYSEVKAMVRLGEENLPIPSIFTTYFDKANSKLYIMMEWIKGTTLKDHMNDPELKILQWMVELCDVLDVMDRKHVYHKDIKPSNIMIDHKGKMHLIDFNISISTPNRTEGTLHYKAPEMAADSKYMGREKTDMFSIGVILYEYYTKEVPMRGAHYARNRSRGPLEWDKFISPKEKNENVNDEINNIIIKCMKMDPKQRYRTYRDLQRALQQAMRGIKWVQKKN